MLYLKLKTLASLGWRTASSLIIDTLKSRVFGLNLHSVNSYKEYSNLLFLANHGVSYTRKSEHYATCHTQIEGKAVDVIVRTLDSDVFVFYQIFILREYQPLVNLYRRSNVGNARTIVDAGANIGLSAIFLAASFPQATLYCIEPDDSNFELLKKNTEGYTSTKFVCLKKALWSGDQSLSFERNFRDRQSWSLRVTDSANTEYSVSAISLTSLREQFGWDGIDVLKIDIEGSEAALFSDKLQMQSALEKVKSLAIEIHNELADEKLIVDTITDGGFECYKGRETVIAINRRFLEGQR